jgi:hypothetical protein
MQNLYLMVPVAAKEAKKNRRSRLDGRKVTAINDANQGFSGKGVRMGGKLVAPAVTRRTQSRIASAASRKFEEQEH